MNRGEADVEVVGFFSSTNPTTMTPVSNAVQWRGFGCLRSHRNDQLHDDRVHRRRRVWRRCDRHSSQLGEGREGRRGQKVW